MGPRFRQSEGEAYARIVREYPLSPLAEEAKKELQKLELPIPEVDQVAYARMKYEQENREKMGPLDSAMDIFKRGPDVRAAAKSGQPAMTSLRPLTPASVPNVPQPKSGTGGGFTGDVSAATVVETGPADSNAAPAGASPDATAPAATGAATEKPADGSAPQAAPTAQTPQGLPSNHMGNPSKKQKKQKKPANSSAPSAPAAAPTTTSPVAPDGAATSSEASSTADSK